MDSGLLRFDYLSLKYSYFDSGIQICEECETRLPDAWYPLPVLIVSLHWTGLDQDYVYVQIGIPYHTSGEVETH